VSPDANLYPGYASGGAFGGGSGNGPEGFGETSPNSVGQSGSIGSAGSGGSAGASDPAGSGGSVGVSGSVSNAGLAGIEMIEDGGPVGDGGPANDAGIAVDGGVDSGQGGTAGTGADPCGPNAEEVSTEPRTAGNAEYGSIDFETPRDIGFISLRTTLTVPKEASGSTSTATLFIWPGLMPGSGSPLSGGVLQSVLTWGSSCADITYNPPNTWWIACMFVPYVGGCQQGDHMDVTFHDILDIEMTLNGTVWSQVATNRSNGQSVSFDIDMGGAPQFWALFAIETWDQRVKPTEDVIFTNTVLKMAGPAPSDSCQPTDTGPTDWLSPPRISQDGTMCCIDKIILRDQGVPATTPNEP